MVWEGRQDVCVNNLIQIQKVMDAMMVEIMHGEIQRKERLLLGEEIRDFLHKIAFKLMDDIYTDQ